MGFSMHPLVAALHYFIPRRVKMSILHPTHRHWLFPSKNSHCPRLAYRWPLHPPSAIIPRPSHLRHYLCPYPSNQPSVELSRRLVSIRAHETISPGICPYHCLAHPTLHSHVVAISAQNPYETPYLWHRILHQRPPALHCLHCCSLMFIT
jgi:hypothetical protein